MSVSVLVMIDKDGMNGAMVALRPFLERLRGSGFGITVFQVVAVGRPLEGVDGTIRQIGFPEWMTRETMMRSILQGRFFRKNGARLFSQALAFHLVAKWASCPRWVLQKLSMHNESYDVAISFCDSFCNRYVRAIRAKKHIGWIHEDYSWALDDINKKEVQKRYLGKLDALCCVSQSSAAVMRSLLDGTKTEILVFHNQVNMTLILAYKWQPDVRETTILSVGRLVEVKRFDWCIRIAKCLKCSGMRFRWEIVGDGPEYQRLERMIAEDGVADCVHLMGRIACPYEKMSRCLIYVQPSREEGWGLAVEEALLIGCQVVCSDLHVFREIGRLLGMSERMRLAKTPEEMAKYILELQVSPAGALGCEAKSCQRRLRELHTYEMEALRRFINND